MGDPAEINMDVSDEEFMKLEEPTFEEPTEDDNVDSPEVDNELDPPEIDDDTPEEVDTVTLEEDEDTPEIGEDGEPIVKDDPPEDLEDTPPNYKEMYENVMGTFKANGSDMAPKNPEDARRLMQMGANYHQKMAGMKPARAALKLLENNGLLEGDALALLIDAKNGNQDAITELVKKHNIKPLDIDVETESDYTPNDHSVSDVEMQLDSVITDIENSPKFQDTVNLVSKQWDSASQNEVASNPEIIKLINQHMESGVYDKVMGGVNYQRSMGQLSGVSDVEAYRRIGKQLDDEGAFNNPATPEKDTGLEKEIPKVDPKKEAKRKSDKKKASPTKETKKPIGSVPKDFNPLAMSDEEFAKFDPATIGIK